MPELETNFPNNFIERSVRASLKGNKFTTSLNGKSTYYEYTEENIWNEEILDDIFQTSEKIVNFVKECKSLEEKTYFGKKIVSLDIETTFWIPKALEGFVNVLGITVLDLRNIAPAKIELLAYQAFNVLRKKEDVPHLLHLAWNHVKDSDMMLVFNKRFDVNILKTIIDNYYLNYEFPETIIDLMDRFKSLKALEEYLGMRSDFRRIHSEKGNFKEYHKLFQGTGKNGVGKQIDPLGVYNLIDTLTPLLAFLIMDDAWK